MEKNDNKMNQPKFLLGLVVLFNSIGLCMLKITHNNPQHDLIEDLINYNLMLYGFDPTEGLPICFQQDCNGNYFRAPIFQGILNKTGSGSCFPMATIYQDIDILCLSNGQEIGKTIVICNNETLNEFTTRTFKIEIGASDGNGGKDYGGSDLWGTGDDWGNSNSQGGNGGNGGGTGKGPVINQPTSVPLSVSTSVFDISFEAIQMQNTNPFNQNKFRNYLDEVFRLSQTNQNTENFIFRKNITILYNYDRIEQYQLSRELTHSILDLQFYQDVVNLETQEDYLNLVQKYGYFFASRISFGGIYQMVSKISTSVYNKSIDKDNNSNLTLGAKAEFSIRGNLQTSLTENDRNELAVIFEQEVSDISIFTYGGMYGADKAVAEWAQTISSNPYPIQMILSPIPDLLTQDFFPQDSEIDLQREKLKLAIMEFIEILLDEREKKRIRDIEIKNNEVVQMCKSDAIFDFQFLHIADDGLSLICNQQYISIYQNQIQLAKQFDVRTAVYYGYYSQQEKQVYHLRGEMSLKFFSDVQDFNIFNFTYIYPCPLQYFTQMIHQEIQFHSFFDQNITREINIDCIKSTTNTIDYSKDYTHSTTWSGHFLNMSESNYFTYASQPLLWSLYLQQCVIVNLNEQYFTVCSNAYEIRNDKDDDQLYYQEKLTEILAPFNRYIARYNITKKIFIIPYIIVDQSLSSFLIKFFYLFQLILIIWVFR